jgi:hypothetical protein
MLFKNEEYKNMPFDMNQAILSGKTVPIRDSEPEVVEEKVENFVIDHLHNGSKTVGRTRSNKGRLYVSESGLCARKSALSSCIEKEYISSPSMPFYTGIGKEVENIILNSLNNAGILVFPDINKPLVNGEHEQFSIPDVGLNLGGKLDGVVYTNGKLHLLEIKTAGQQLPTNPELTKPQNVAQARIYSAILGMDVILFYMSRNVSSDRNGEKLKVKEFVYKFDRGASYKYIYETALAKYCIDHKLIPPIPAHINASNIGNMCSYCAMFNYCWGTESVVEDFPDFTIPTEHELLVASNNAHLTSGEILKPDNIKQRRRDFIYNIKQICNPALSSVVR